MTNATIISCTVLILLNLYCVLFIFINMKKQAKSIDNLTNNTDTNANISAVKCELLEIQLETLKAIVKEYAETLRVIYEDPSILENEESRRTIKKILEDYKELEQTY